MGIKLDSIFPVQSRLNAAQDTPIMVEGGILLIISATNPETGVTKTTHQLCYISRHVNSTFLSLSACIDLGLVPSSFPEVGLCDTLPPTASVQSMSTPSKLSCSNSGVPISYTCYTRTTRCTRRRAGQDTRHTATFRRVCLIRWSTSLQTQLRAGETSSQRRYSW